MMPDGTLETLGQIDTQIKLRGVRIESEATSAVLGNAASGFPGRKTQLDASTVLAKYPVLQTDQLVSFILWNTSVSITQRRMQKPHISTSASRGLFGALRMRVLVNSLAICARRISVCELLTHEPERQDR